ncbi:unnamed protein product, partial [Laminaria digitata]
DLRLYAIGGVEDETVCNNEKLQSGSTAKYVRSCKHFLDWQIFQEGTDWPSAIMAPAFLVNTEKAANVAIEVIMSALPANWRGTLVMVEHMSAFGFHWTQRNPTRKALEDVGMRYRSPLGRDNGYGKLSRYQEQDPRTTFISVFPMYQSKLYENQNSQRGKRWYGGSQHFHYMTSSSHEEAYNGAQLVHSTMTEMISNIVIGKAVGTKSALYAISAIEGSAHAVNGSKPARDTFTMCTDCPSGLVPFHVQPKPEPACANHSALPGHAPAGEAWDNQLCPEWCMETEPVGQAPTESGPVDVRRCPVNIPPP